MKIRELLDKLTVHTNVKIRKNNDEEITFNSEGMLAIREDILDAEVDTWRVWSVTGQITIIVNFIETEGEN